MSWFDPSVLWQKLLAHQGREAAYIFVGIVAWIVWRLLWRRVLIILRFSTSRRRALNAVAR